MSEKKPSLCLNVRKICRLVKNGSSMHLGDDGAKELVIIRDHVHFFHENEWTRDCILSSREGGPLQNACVTGTGSERSVRGLAFY